jgi:hypothetical protein
LSKIKGDTECFEDKKITLKGIDNDQTPIKTIGYCYFDLLVNKKIYTQVFHVVKDNFPIPFDGIIGNNFLKAHDAVIDYQNDYLKIEKECIKLNHIQVPIEHSTNKCDELDDSQIPATHCKTQTTNSIIIQPRSETVIPIEINNPEIGEGIIDQITVIDGVFLCPSLVKVQSDSKAIYCNNSSSYVNIARTGILALQPTCKASTKSTTILSSANFESSYEKIISPANDILNNTKTIDMLSVNISQLQISNLNYNEVNLASHKLQDIIQITDSLIENKTTKQNLTTYSYLTYSLFIMLLIFALYKLGNVIKNKIFQKCYSNKKHGNPEETIQDSHLLEEIQRPQINI